MRKKEPEFVDAAEEAIETLLRQAKREGLRFDEAMAAIVRAAGILTHRYSLAERITAANKRAA